MVGCEAAGGLRGIPSSHHTPSPSAYMKSAINNLLKSMITERCRRVAMVVILSDCEDQGRSQIWSMLWAGNCQFAFNVNQHIFSLISIHLYWRYQRYCRVTMIRDFHRNMKTRVHLLRDGEFRRRHTSKYSLTLIAYQ